MLLKFYAREDLLVNDPNSPARDGDSVARVGRKFKRAKRGQDGAVVEPASYEASKDPHEVDSDSHAGRRLAKLCRRDRSLWPADKATADFCDVAFVATVFKDGAHVAAPPAPPKPVSSGKKD
jgi:hypothetical protein